MLKVAIVGCGKIADAHASQIQFVPECQMVATCDSELLMARQLAERFSIQQSFANLDELLNDARPDVVHITTPPESHFALARRCLLAGSHVYVEKPFTLCESEAQDLIDLAIKQGLKVTVGHDDQFTHATRRMRALVASGYLGGDPVHMEAYYGYELRDNSYARALLCDKTHWVRRLPGKLLQNVISHGIARIAEYLNSDSPAVFAQGFRSPLLKKLNEEEIIDEARVTICTEGGPSAYFTFSSQMRPSLHQFRIYGPNNGILLDRDYESVVKLPGDRLKSYLQYFVPPMRMAGQYLENAAINIRAFMARDFHLKGGMRFLINEFYQSILEGTPLPISYREILLTARIMDSIFDQLKTQHWRDAVAAEEDVAASVGIAR